MKIRLSQLRQIIREEVSRTMSQAAVDPEVKAAVEDIVDGDPKLQANIEKLKNAIQDEGLKEEADDTVSPGIFASGMVVLGSMIPELISGGVFDQVNVMSVMAVLASIGIVGSTASMIANHFLKKNKK
jgi:hypothetical protein